MPAASRPKAALAICLAAATSILTLAMVATRDEDVPAGVVVTVVLTVIAATGALVAVRRPDHPCGWLMVGAALSFAASVAATDFVQASVSSDRLFAGTRAIGWFSTWLAAPVIGLGALLVMTFPSGSFGSPRFRLLGRAVIGASCVHALTLAITPGTLPVAGSLTNPLGIDGAESVLDVVATLATFVVVIGSVAAVVRLVVRSRRATGLEREQLRLVGRAVVLAGVGLAIAMIVSGPMNELSFYVAAISLSTVPVAIGWAVLKHGLFDIDVLVSRALVFGVLTAMVAALYVLIVGLTGFLVGGSLDLRISLLAAAVIAVVFGPAHEALQRHVDRLMYGDRGAPYEVLTRLTGRFEDATGPEHVLPVAIAEIGTSLKLRWVGVDLLHDHEMVRACTWGDDSGPAAETFELVHGGELVGTLSVRARADEQLRARDRTLLEALCAPIAAAAHAINVNAELQESRQSLVTAMEQERRRLRADLHDGLGPELAGVGMTVAAARLELQRNPEAADALLQRVQDQVRGAVTQVRLLVDGLAPAVDQLGLVGAVRQGADRLGSDDSVCFEVEAAALPLLPAAVEVAAYRIAMEAMTNVVRHTSAQHCAVRLVIDDARLTLEVADDGAGLPMTIVPGVGLSSMRRRAAELGGVCTIERSVDGGTRVLAELPLA